jgi:hypothetical protein
VSGDIWAEGAAIARNLTRAEDELLQLIVRLPLAWVAILQALLGAAGPASVYRRVSQLKALGLVSGVRVPWRPGSCPELLVVTSLGLATAARGDVAQFAELAHAFRLSTAQISARIPGMAQLGACYELLAAAARSRPHRVRILNWQEPWRAQVERPTAKAPVWLRLPAFAGLTWANGDCAEYLLLPDLGTRPLRAYRHQLDSLLLLRARQEGRLPGLIVATEPARVGAWDDLLHQTAVRRHEALLGWVVTWSDVQAGMVAPLPRRIGPPAPMLAAAAPTPSARTGLEKLDRELARQLAGERFERAVKLVELARVSTPIDRQAMWLIGRHLLLTKEQLAQLIGASPDHVRRRIRMLLDRGFLLMVSAAEIGPEAAAAGLLEATEEGLRFVAATLGLTLSAAIRFHGLAGGGPENPLGARRGFIRNVAHTRGLNRLMAGLGPLTRDEDTDGLIGWDSASASSRGGTRPDAYCACRRDGQPLGFFIEYDRGTMSQAAYLHKLNGYYDYRDTQRFERDYCGYPAILFVTTDNAAENRLAAAARLAARGRGAGLPLLLTTEWRVYDRRNPDGLFGAIWRAADEPFACRHAWPAEIIRGSSVSR